MRLLLIRHGDPDYVHDCLTGKGKREAQLLAKLAPSLDLGDVYVSVMGRAQETASYSLRATGKPAKTVDWIQEFITDLNLNRHPELVSAYGPDTPLTKDYINRPDFAENYKSCYKILHPDFLKDYLPDPSGNVPKYAPRIVWDILPSYLMKHPELYDPEDWKKSDLAKAAHVEECAAYVFRNFDAMLQEHGYRRDGLIYRAEHANEGTVTCFCHLGLTCLLVAHLTSQSPFAVWQHYAFAPSSVTEFRTEEREKGIAIFRALRLGDISHLTMGGEKPSFSARFCETYDNFEQRH